MDITTFDDGDGFHFRRWFALSRLSLWCGLFAIALGSSVLLGWLYDIELLKTLLVGYASMKPNTAVALGLLGIALSRRSIAAMNVNGGSSEPDTIATWCAGIVVAFAAATLLEYAATINLGIDQLLFREASPSPHPGRMAIATAMAILALGLSLVTPRAVENSLIDARAVPAFLALAISAVALIGYLFDAPSLYQLSAYVSMALHTSIGLIILSCGTLLYLNIPINTEAAATETATQQTLASGAVLKPIMIAMFGLISLLAAGSIFLFLSVIKAQSLLQHTFIVHQSADSLLAALRDAETGQRGFVVTGNPAYLEPYDRGIANIHVIQENLKKLTGDKPAQQLRLNAIASQTEEKMLEIRQTIDFERSGRHTAALDLITGNGGKAMMEGIRDNLTAFLAEEDALLDQRQVWLKKMQNAGITTAMLTLLLIVAAGGAIANTLYAYFNGLKSARRDLSVANASLDRIVSERTAELDESERQRRFALEVAELGDWKLDVASDQSVRSTRHDRIFGYDTPPKQWGFTQFIEHVIPEDRDFVTAAFERAIATKADWRFECRIHRYNDNEIRWIEVQGKHYDSEITGQKGLLGTVADITGRKLGELSLATSNRRLALISQVSNDLIFGTSPRELLRSAFDAIANEVGAEYYFNYLVDTTQPGWLELEAAGGLDDDQRRAFRHIAFGQYLCGRVAQTRQAIVLDNIDQSTDPAAAGVKAMGIRSYAGLPLAAQGKLFGTLAFGSIAPRFDDADIELIKLISDQFAATLDRTQLVKALAESDERQRLAISAAAFATWDVDLETGRAKWSKDHYGMFGYATDESGEATLEMWRERIHPNDLKGVMEKVEQAKSQLSTYSSEHRIIRADDGTVRWLAASGRFQTDNTGAAHRLVGVVRDITENKQAEALLVESEARFRGTFENAAVGVAHVALDGHWIEVNDCLCSLVGYSREELLKGTFQDITHPDDLQTDMAFVRQLLADEIPHYSMDKRYIRRDGSIIWIGLTVALRRHHDGEPRYFISVIRDITARKDAENHQRFLMRELAHRSKNLMAVIDSIAGQTVRSVATLDEFRNRFSQRLQGLSASQEVLLNQDWRGAPIADLVRSQLAPFSFENDERLVLSGPNFSVNTAAAQALGLALHELATNATKYGALSVPTGKIYIAWSVDAPNTNPQLFRMSWVESGGPPVTSPTRTGFGNMVIERMAAASLNGRVTLTYPETGVSWQLEAPVSSCIGDGRTAEQDF